MPPLRILNVKVIVFDVRPLPAVLHLDDLMLGVAFDLPDRRRRVARDDQEQPAKLRVWGQMRLGQFVFALADRRFDPGYLMFGAIGGQAARKGAGHLAQMIVVQMRVVAVQLPPPGAQAAARLAHRKIGVQHDAIHAVVSPCQQLGVVSREVIMGIHPKTYSHQTTFAPAIRQRRIPFSQRQSGKRRSPLPKMCGVATDRHHAAGTIRRRPGGFSGRLWTCSSSSF